MQIRHQSRIEDNVIKMDFANLAHFLLSDDEVSHEVYMA